MNNRFAFTDVCVQELDHRGGMVVEGVSSGGFPFVELGLKETKRFPFPSVDHVHIY